MSDYDYSADRCVQLLDWIREAAERICVDHEPTRDEHSPRHYTRHAHVELTYQRADEILRYTRALYVLVEGLRPERTTHVLGLDDDSDSEAAE